MGFPQSISGGPGDVATTSWGVVDDVASKIDNGGFVCDVASNVGVSDVVWVPVSRLGGF